MYNNYNLYEIKIVYHFYSNPAQHFRERSGFFLPFGDLGGSGDLIARECGWLPIKRAS
jgi:hypothetical protein